MSKQIRDYALGEVMELCNGRIVCRGCPFYIEDHPAVVCALRMSAPSCWNLSGPPRWTPEEVERANAIKVLWPNAKIVRRDTTTCTIEWFKNLGGLESCGTIFISNSHFPSLHHGETVALDDIIKEG